MVRSYVGEQWKEIPFTRQPAKHYAVSSFGRVASYRKSIKDDGFILKQQFLKGYPMINSDVIRKNHTAYVHKLVASFFLQEKDDNKKFVIHKDYNKSNNHIDNLKWATREEMLSHYQQNPNVIEARKRQKGRKVYKGHKLTETQVKLIKKKIFDPNRKTRMKIIAKQFGISEMQLYRIKSGENWGHVKV